MRSQPVERALGASYELEERIGCGATGQVWRARDRRTGAVVAVKVLHDEHLEDASLVRRFVGERHLLVGLQHPAVVRVLDLVVERARLAVVMELVPGGSLRDVLVDDGPLPPALALGVAAAVLDGLAAAHDRGVVHRDVKPDNVLLVPGWRGLGPGAVKVGDFGVAALVAGGAPTSADGDAEVLGTPEYLAPERLVTGAGGPPADVYGAGVLLHELLSGRTPFAGPGTPATVAERHVSSRAPGLPLPDPVQDALAGLLAKDPRRRPGAEMAAEGLRRLAPGLAALPALPLPSSPGTFRSALGPATEVRGLARPGRRVLSPSGTDSPTAAAGPSRPRRRSRGPGSARRGTGAAG